MYTTPVPISFRRFQKNYMMRSSRKTGRMVKVVIFLVPSVFGFDSFLTTVPAASNDYRYDIETNLISTIHN